MIITIPRNISYCLTAIFGHPSSSACHWSQIGWLNILQSLQSKSLHCNSGSPKNHVISLDLIGTYYYVKLVWFCPLECHTWSSPKFPCRNHVFKQQSASPRPMLAHGDSNARAETVVCVSSECCNQMVSMKHVVPNHPHGGHDSYGGLVSPTVQVPNWKPQLTTTAPKNFNRATRLESHENAPSEHQ